MVRLKALNIKDIARMAGVSVSTVSRVMNNHADVSDEKRKAVLDIIKENNYIPNDNARNLKQNSTKNIAIIVKGAHNSLFSYLLEGFERIFDTTGYSIIVNYIEQDQNEIKRAEIVCREKKPLGIIFLGADIKNFKEGFSSIKIPCIVSTTDTTVLRFSNLSSISVDDEQGGYLAIDYLIKKDHKDIFVLGSSTSFAANLRFSGAMRRFKDSKIKFDKNLFADADFSIQKAYNETKKALESGKKFTAIFAMSDLMAIGAIKSVCDFGLSVPKDISVMGFDGIEMSKFYNPSLTTLKQPLDEMTTSTAKLILRAIEKNKPSDNILYNVEVVEGGSVTEPQANRRV